MRCDLELRGFRGSGFRVKIPEHWLDRSIYAFAGPQERRWVPRVNVLVDEDPGVTSGEDYTRVRLEAKRQTLPGYRLLRNVPTQLRAGPVAQRTEVRWFAGEDVRLYERAMFVLWGGVGFALSSSLSREARPVAGPTLDRIFASFAPAPDGAPRPPAKRGEEIELTLDRFALRVPPAWRDETVYVLAEPDDSRFRRNLVVVREEPEPPPARLEDIVDASIGRLERDARGFTLVERGRTITRAWGSICRLAFLRSTREGKPILQHQVFALRGETLFTQTLTIERRIPEAEIAGLAGAMDAFDPCVPTRR